MISSSRPVTVADVRDHYEELDRHYREIWGEHVHHGLWERGDETAHEAVLKLIRSVAATGRSQLASACAMWDADTEGRREFSRLN